MRPIPLFTLLLLAVAAGTAAAQVLDTGTFAADLTAEAWALNAGAGSRTHILFIRFHQPFPERPAVLLSLGSLDGAAGKDGNIRVRLVADNITREGFVLKITTWADSRLAGVAGQWMAVLPGTP